LGRIIEIPNMLSKPVDTKTINTENVLLTPRPSIKSTIGLNIIESIRAMINIAQISEKA
jgi:hypothetical protein